MKLAMKLSKMRENCQIAEWEHNWWHNTTKSRLNVSFETHSWDSWSNCIECFNECFTVCTGIPMVYKCVSTLTRMVSCTSNTYSLRVASLLVNHQDEWPQMFNGKNISSHSFVRVSISNQAWFYVMKCFYRWNSRVIHLGDRHTDCATRKKLTLRYMTECWLKWANILYTTGVQLHTVKQSLKVWLELFNEIY